METIKLLDVANNPEHPIMKEVMHSLNGNEGDNQICKNCGNQYERGIWDFYGLCDPCFSIFDEERTKKRLEWLKNEWSKDN